jgi:2-keto-4-pentenoate hydratase/2-oxohepta-3-ene-1,7-dioic acid hydratase in catechol pathway
MKICSFKLSGLPTYGVVSDGEVRAVAAHFLGSHTDLTAALAHSTPAEIAAAALDSDACRINELEFLPPIPAPSKIVCVGMNYLAHIKEMGREPPEYPALFIRHSDSLVGHGCSIVRSRVSTHYDYEGELAIIIGRAARYIKAADAGDYIAGYTCFMDGSVRDFQRHTTQFTAGKNFPSSGACGPWLVTTDEIPDPQRLHLQTRVNGEIMQQGEIRDLCFGVFELIEYISTATQLMPGDVIATGTPSGVGAARKPPRWLKSGDFVEVAIDGVGVLQNRVKDEL